MIPKNYQFIYFIMMYLCWVNLYCLKDEVHTVLSAKEKIINKNARLIGMSPLKGERT